MGSIKKNFLYNAAYQLLTVIVPLITTPHISRVLGADGIGKYSYNYSIAYYFVIFITLGLNNYGNREIARNNTSKNDLSKSFWSMYLFQLSIGIIINAIYFGYCIFFASDIHIALALSLYTISGIFDINWFFFGIEEFKFITIRNTIIKIATTISIFLFVRDSKDVILYTLIMAIGLLVSQILLLPYLLKKISFCKVKFADIVRHIKPNCFLFLTVIAVSVYKILAKIMLGFMTTETQVGYFESSERIIQVPMLLVTALGTVMLPRMSNMVLKNREKSFQTITISIIFAMFLSSSMCFGIMGIAKEFVPLFYGAGFEPCVYIFLFLLPSCLFLAFSNVIRTQYVLPNQLDAVYVKSVFWGALVNVVLNLILIPKWQAIGASIGTLMAETAVCFYVVLCVRKELPIKEYIKLSCPFVVSGVIMFCVIFNIHLSFANELMGLIVKIGIGVLVYLITLGGQILFYAPLKKTIISLIK